MALVLDKPFSMYNPRTDVYLRFRIKKVRFVRTFCQDKVQYFSCRLDRFLTRRCNEFLSFEPDFLNLLRGKVVFDGAIHRH